MSEPHRQQSIPLGTILDERFELKEILGAGSFGQVYRANQLVFGKLLRSVALKLFFADRVTAENVDSVFSDAILLLSLQEDHPDLEVARHLVQVYDMGLLQDGEYAYMSMRLVPGCRTLQHAVRRHGKFGMPVDLALQFLRQMLVPLAWMHTLPTPVVHGDLKPDNILLTTETELVLTDFGLASRLPLGVRGGAIAYQAQETLNRMTGRTESDIFAIGVILYEMLTGRHPYENVGQDAQASDDQPALIAAHREARKWELRPPSHWNPYEDDQRIVPPSEINSELKRHPQLEEMLARCLRWSEHERYRHAQELLADVDDYIDSGVASGLVSKMLSTSTKKSQEAAKPGATSPAAVLANAAAMRERNELDAAHSSVNKLLLTDSRNERAWVLKVQLELDMGRIQDARGSCAQAQQNVGQTAAILDVIADVFEHCQQPTMAKNYRKKAFQARQRGTR